MITWKLLPLGTRLLIAAGVFIAAVSGVIGAWKLHGAAKYNEGWNAAIAKIAAKDKEAIDAVKSKTQEVDDCYASRGEWDVTRGVCNR